MYKFISVAFICDESYVLPTLVSMTSVVNNKSEDIIIDFYIISPGLSDNSLKYFLQLANEKVRVFIKISDDDLSQYHVPDDGNMFRAANETAMLKFKIADILNGLDKVIYLDGDTICRECLYKIYSEDISDFYLAAVAESSKMYYKKYTIVHPYMDKYKSYFNSGMMVLNLEMMRKTNAFETLLDAKKQMTDSYLMDQDQLNAVFDNKVKFLPIRYNTQYVNLVRAKSMFNMKQLNSMYHTDYETLEDLEIDIAILHYSSKDKPWKHAGTTLAYEWYEYFLQTKLLCPTLSMQESQKFQKVSYNKGIKVSVVIPSYNVESFIRECVESIIKQTLTELQIICVNDGSTDMTQDILYEIKNHDNRVVVINQENKGLSAARNAGIEIAEGEYIYFIDGDDILKENALEKLYNKARNTNAQIVFFDADSFFDDKHMEKKYAHYKKMYLRTREYTDVYKGDALFVEMDTNRDYISSACLMLIERKYLVDINHSFRNGILHEDHLFTFPLLLLSQRATHMRASFYQRRVRKNSIMTNKYSYKNFFGIYTCLVELTRFAILNEENLSTQAVLALERHIIEFQKQVYDGFFKINQNERFKPVYFEPSLHLVARLFEYGFDYANNRTSTLRKELASARNSASRKVWRLITFLPRKAIGFFMCWSDHGFSYAIKHTVRKMSC